MTIAYQPNLEQIAMTVFEGVADAEGEFNITIFTLLSSLFDLEFCRHPLRLGPTFTKGPTIFSCDQAMHSQINKPLRNLTL